MKSGNNIWERIDTALVIVGYTTLDELKKYREAMRDSGLNVNNCELMAIVEDKKEREILSHQSIATFISDKDLNFLGQLKNASALKILGRKYDTIFFLGDPPKRLRKVFAKTTRKLSVGVNCTNTEQNVNLETEEDSPLHLINFARQTLEKII